MKPMILGTVSVVTFPGSNDVPKSIGGTLLATNSLSDFTFIRLADDPHDGQGLAAWTDEAVSSEETVTGIHHPQGGLKRIGFGTLTSSPPICAERPQSDYWYLNWNLGITEAGSSGSPLFNSSWQVVGQLFGICDPNGYFGCSNPLGFNTLYGKFGVTYPSIATWLNTVTPDDSYEDNDTLAQAAPITCGGHNLQLVDLEDYYAIVSPDTGQVSVTVTYNTADMIVELQLLQPDGTVIAESDTASGTENVVENLPAGPYVIRLLKEHKWGGDYMLNISLPPAYCDFDVDGDVDMDDFGHLQRCYTGSEIQGDPACYNACLDGDGLVDLSDMSLFNGCYSGPNVPASVGCTP